VQATSTDVTDLVEAQQALDLHAREMQALSEIASILVESRTLEEKSARAMEVVARIAQGDRVILRRVDEERQRLRVVAMAGRGIEAAPPLGPIPLTGENLVATTYREIRTLVVNDYAADPRSYPEMLETCLTCR